jgi:3D (Asp-Asp-Asp) domain-containing protein
MTVVATAYCSCKSCCGIYAENRPDGVVCTASGTVAKANHTIAVDTSVIPFGTKVLYNCTEYVAEDTGSAIKGNKIDIYFDNHSDALSWGKRTIEIEVVK